MPEVSRKTGRGLRWFMGIMFVITVGVIGVAVYGAMTDNQPTGACTTP